MSFLPDEQLEEITGYKAWHCQCRQSDKEGVTYIKDRYGKPHVPTAQFEGTSSGKAKPPVDYSILRRK